MLPFSSVLVIKSLKSQNIPKPRSALLATQHTSAQVSGQGKKGPTK